MPDGRVLSYGSPQGQGVQDGRSLDMWTPALGFAPVSHLSLANAQAVDSFCGTSALLPQTGNVLLSGGSSYTDNYQANQNTIVTPSTAAVANSNLNSAQQRWYATMISLSDGRQLIGGGGAAYAIGGNTTANAPTDGIAITPEIFSAGKGWTQLTGATSTDAFGPAYSRGWYPRMWVAPDGTVFGISTDKMWQLDPNANTIRTVGNFKTPADNSATPNVGPTSTAVMYAPGKILQVGGNGYTNSYQSPSSPYATIIDISTPNQPKLTEVKAMTYARQWPNSLVLPDSKILVTGGSTYSDNAGNNAVYAAEIWNPATGTWTVGASAANYRGYHSATVLLPDGVVLSTGGGVPGPVNNLNAEIFYPPYLFTKSGNGSALAARPQIVSYSTNTPAYGAKLSVEMADTGPVGSASLIGLSAVTHSFNTSQRFIPITITGAQQGKLVNFTMPTSAAVAPPGYYLLTVTNAAGTPSAGVVVALNAAAPAAKASVQAVLPNNAANTSANTMTKGNNVELSLDNATHSFELLSKPGNVVRHANFTTYLNAISPQSSAVDRNGGSFFIRPGSADLTCYTFESIDWPGYVLRHQNYRLNMQKSDNSALFQADSTFCAIPGLSGAGYSLVAYNFPDHVVHVRDGSDIWIDTPDGSATFAQASSFATTQEILPTDNVTHSLAVLGMPFTLVRHANYVGYIASINTASLGDRADASFFIRPGLADNTCYSLEASNFPGYFLHHVNYQLRLEKNDSSAVFTQTATFCLRNGLAGAGMSLQPLNYPNYYLHLRGDTSLWIDQTDNSAGFNAASTFALAPAP